MGLSLSPRRMPDSSLKPVRTLGWIVVAFSLAIGLSTCFRASEIVPWRTDLDAAERESKQTGKPVLLYFTASWCGPCREMKHTTWADANVVKAIEAYVPVKIDVDRNPALAKEFGVAAIPHIAVLDAAGKETRMIEGALTPERMVRWLGR